VPAIKITKDVLASYLNCKYKAHLKLSGQHGTTSQYETLLTDIAQGLTQRATETILAQTGKAEVLRHLPLTYHLLKQGAPYILDAMAEDNDLSLRFDGLKRIDGSSRLGVFHYIPLLFHGGETIRQQEKNLLALYGHVLGSIQAQCPSSGIVIYGPQCKMAKLRLTTNPRKTNQIFQELRSIRQPSTIPPLILNDHCHICEFQQRCHTQATGEDNLSLLKGMTEKEIKKHNRRGIFTVTQLSYTYRPRRKSARSKQANPHHNFALQALAIRDKRVFISSVPAFSSEPVSIYLDIEGIPDRRFNYLIGALVCTKTSVVHHSFWADGPPQEIEILRSFLHLVSSFDWFRVFHYGAYETTVLKRMRSLVQPSESIDRVLAHSTNILSMIYGHIYFPVYSNSLKDVAPFLGYAWADQSVSGINSTVWRRQWESSASPDLKERLIIYNRDDCAALKLVTDFIHGLTDQLQQNDVNRELVAGSVAVSRIPDVKPQFNRPDWGKPQFARPDFDYINRCSYFEYQREKIYARTNKNMAKQNARKKRRAKKRRHQEEVEIPCSACPNCGSREAAKSPERRRFRQFFDLRIRSTCVRHVTWRVGSYKYRCRRCGREYYPDQYVNHAKYGHSLKSWAIYEHVAHRASFENLEETLRDLFCLSVGFRDLHVFKSIMANYYRETYRGIMQRLGAGSILHADETEVHLKQVGKGYVWVFTNLEEVLYVYKTSREGKFLAEMFAGFSGVLISDFYAAYDSLGCPQQKCLVHLIRDLNTQLLSNPFDEEFKTFVSDFGSLLRRIIATVDRYGLKRHHLAKHQREVDRFFDRLTAISFGSEAARAVQERMNRNRDNLFTFLEYDGVPWNNNNAEHAVKRFAYYRELTDGLLSEAGLMDYLVLLSIQQTCEYKGIGFLKFLLSGEIDLGCYRDRRRVQRRAMYVETSPLEREFFDRRGRRRAPPVQL
jgi:predicted RecB family nuclease